jgi:TonB family protein
MKIKNYLIVFLSFLVSQSLLAQNDLDSVKIDTNSISHKNDTIKVHFPGGEKALYDYIASKINYPPIAFEKGIQGKVITQFIVRKDGSITDEETLGDKFGYGLEEEAIMVIKNMPNWEPTVINGVKFSVRYKLPIEFSIDEDL